VLDEQLASAQVHDLARGAMRFRRRCFRHLRAFHARPGRPQIRLRVDEELTGDDDFVAFGEAFTDFALAADSTPSSTSCGRNLPSLSATMTTLRSPVRITASEGTRSALISAPCAKASVANMPGFNLPPGLPSSTRARSVRVAAFTSGRIALTRPRKDLAGEARHARFDRRSGTQPRDLRLGHFGVDPHARQIARRNSIAPDITVMPSRTPSSAMTPLIGA